MTATTTTRSGFAGLDPCVHCGFCLQACPTFLATGDEADSPRGRIVLMQALDRGTLPPTDRELHRHLDRCLGCRACETACPSGVSYGRSLEAARDILESARPLPLLPRLVLAVMADPALRRPLLTLARWFRPFAAWFAGRSRVGFGLASLAATRPAILSRRPASTGPAPRPDRTAVIFTGCIMEGLFGHVHEATARTLTANGYDLATVPTQGCCGALHAHAGRHEDAVTLAVANVRAFRSAPDAGIAVNSAGCGAMLREYGHLLADHPLADEAVAFARRVCDVSEMLADRGPRPGGPLPITVAYDPPCHLCHAQRVVDAPERVLAAIPGLRRTRHAQAEACCGSAGLYSLQQARLSRRILDTKLAALAAADPEPPDVIVTGNPGCAMHLGAGVLLAGMDARVMHPVELLAWSYDRETEVAGPGAAGQ